LGHLAEIHLPKEMTCGFGTDAHSLDAMQNRTNINKKCRSMSEDWHERGIGSMTLEQRKRSVCRGLDGRGRPTHTGSVWTGEGPRLSTSLAGGAVSVGVGNCGHGKAQP